VLADYASAMATGCPAALPATSFIECLGFERTYRESEQWVADRDYLLDQLRGTTPALFDRPATGTPLAPVRRHYSSLDRSLVNQLRDNGISFFPYLCTIVATYLTRVLGTDQVTLGIPLTNRNNLTEMATVGGHFANALP